MKKIICFAVVGIIFLQSKAQHSVARQWNEVLLEAIRNDFARPTVHARNLFHISIAMYDAWAAYDDQASPYLLGNQIGDFVCLFDGIATDDFKQSRQEEAMSYATYRLIQHRFRLAPKAEDTFHLADSLFIALGYDPAFSSTDYSNNNPAALGNYIAEQLIRFGLQDGSNEAEGYANRFYQRVNGPLNPNESGNRYLFDPNRWQPLSLDVAFDQAGNPIPAGAIPFLSPEWGQVIPFALTKDNLTIYNRRGEEYYVYHDPGNPCFINAEIADTANDEYKWNFSLVSVWASHLDTADQVMWDISPASIGNLKLADYPTTLAGLHHFYDFFEGGDISLGHLINPITNEPYNPQIVPRADYARVLAEFWADGPDSETPPGHWFTIMNYVNDQIALEKRFNGQGAVLDDLEWDVKAYFMLGGAMHDAAISAWGIKGWYDYIRPISAIRYMGNNGQSSDNSDTKYYHPAGFPLIDGYIELIKEGDSLAGVNNEHIGKIKLYTWRGPSYINNPETDKAGVGWIRAEDWWPYQQPTFVTPPFAGYVSGHSTFSRAAAEVLTSLTGDAYFPNGMGVFEVKQNEFLEFEEGPSVNMQLQWATYRDASDQCSLSRIWGGIHPPVDDIPGRLIGAKVGIAAFEKALPYFNLETVHTEASIKDELSFYPNPVRTHAAVQLDSPSNKPLQIKIYDLLGKKVYENLASTKVVPAPSNRGIYLMEIKQGDSSWVKRLVVE